MSRSFVRRRDSRVLMLHPSAMQATYEPRELRENEIVDGIGVVCIDGPLESKRGAPYFDDYECVLQRFRDVIYCDETRAVLLKIDSPGGDAAGLNECVAAMRRCKEEMKKPVYAYADEGAYSAAYALCCAADSIYLPEPGGLGSIGVIVAMVSVARANAKLGVDVQLVYSGDRKADGNPDAPITEEAVAHAQRRVDQLAKIYWNLVAETRALKVSAVRAMQADTFYGFDAVTKGLADDVIGLDDLMTVIRSRLDLCPTG